MDKNTTVLVGMSGGVDSSVAALILKEQGYNVIGATMSIWDKKNNDKLALSQHKCSHGACYGPDEAEDIEEAKKICNRLGIKHYVFDCIEQYNKIVLENFKRDYLAGRTPNPCIWCNSLIKFDLLPKLAAINGIEFDKFATGHYARVELAENGRYLLKTAKNIRKDQSYFLYRLKQEQLKNILFPLGNYSKEEVRQFALNYGLAVAKKPDSQDFYAGDYNELLGVEKKIGNIVDVNGNILGQHEGIWNYTPGQRKGLKISAKEPLYVIELRNETNEVVVGVKSKTFRENLIADNLNWISIPNLEKEIKCKAKIRSSQTPTEVFVKPISTTEIKVRFEDLQASIAKGQSIVLYDDDIVIGGDIIV